MYATTTTSKEGCNLTVKYRKLSFSLSLRNATLEARKPSLSQTLSPHRPIGGQRRVQHPKRKQNTLKFRVPFTITIAARAKRLEHQQRDKTTATKKSLCAPACFAARAARAIFQVQFSATKSLGLPYFVNAGSGEIPVMMR